MKTNMARRMLALLLCCAMLLPNLSPLASAVASLSDAGKSDKKPDSSWVPVVPTDIPAYITASGSVSQQLVCDDGNSLTQDKAKSYFRMVTGTTLAEFNAYLAKLEDAGFTKTAENAIAGKTGNTQNINTRWLSPNEDYVLVVYYTPAYNEVKIVADTAEDTVKSYAGGFVYEGGEAVTTVMLTSYGLSMSDNGFDATSAYSPYDRKQRNCGTLIVIRMPDNSLFVNDGGDLHQWSDEFCEEFLNFCRKVTGTAEGEKVVFNTWFVSHAHSDHFGGLPRFIDRHHDAIDIHNVLYSMDDENIGSTRDMTSVMKMVKAYYPAVKYYKPHTGEKLNVCGIEFDVLYTQEDRFLPAADGSLSVGDPAKKTRDGGTYRDFLQELEEGTAGQYDFNDTSTVLKVIFPHEVTGQARDYTSLLYADVNWGAKVITDMYPASLLQADIMMVPHHGHDAHADLVELSNASIFLYTQDKKAIYGPDGVVDYKKESDGTYVSGSSDASGTVRGALVRDYLAMHDIEGEKYFDTTATRKTYWEGSETAVIFFGEGASFSEAEKLGLSRDSQDPAGYTVYIGEAADFPYEGWTLLSNVVGTDAANTPEVPVGTTESPRASAVELKTDGTKNNLLSDQYKYIIVHNKTDLVMSAKVPYDERLIAEGNSPYATAAPARPGSLTAGLRTDVDKGTKDVYFTWSNSTSTDSNIYFANYMRDAILWNFSTKKWDNTALTVTGTPVFGGNAEEFYYRSVWSKGLSSEEPYWETTENDAWRWLVPSQEDLFDTPATSASYNIRVEFFSVDNNVDVDGDGTVESCDTCVIYYNSGTTDYRFLTVDAEGNWICKKYSSRKAAEADLEDNKLRLYRYNPRTASIPVDTVGPQTYTVNVGTKVDAVVGSIGYQLAVRDTYLRNMEIPCSGQTPKAGYYWLDGDLSTDVARTGSIDVKFHNDDGSDTLLTTLTYHVIGESMVDSEVLLSGVADASSPVGGNVFETRDDAGVVNDRLFTAVMNTPNGYERRELSVKVGMLTYNENTTVTTPEGATSQAGAAGALVNTKVPSGTVYEGLTLSYQGIVVSDNFTLQVLDVTLLDPEYPTRGAVKVDKQGTAAGNSFFSTGIANVQLSATGIPHSDGVDLIITLDMSGSMTQAVSSTDATERLAALKSAMKEMIATLQASEVDFRIAISDFGDLDHYMLEDAVADKGIRDYSFFDTTGGVDWNPAVNSLFGTNTEFYNHLNFVFSEYKLKGYYNANGDRLTEEAYNALSDAEKLNYTYIHYDYRAQPFNTTITKWNEAHDQYTGLKLPNVYTGSNKTDADAFVSVKDKSYAEWCTLIDNFKQGNGYWYGTNYDCGLEYMYRLGYAIQQSNIDKGLDREIVGVFMSDGAPMQYNYFSGRTVTAAWPAWFTGKIDPATFQSAAFDETNRPAKLVELENLLLKIIQTQSSAVTNIDALIKRASDAEKRLTDAGIVDENGDPKYKDNSIVRAYDAGGKAIDYKDMVNSAEAYFLLEKIEDSKTLYNAMLRNGIIMNTRIYENIAAVNGYTIDLDTVTEEEYNTVDAALLAKAKENTLRYPVISAATRYVYDPDATDLRATLEAVLGRPVGYLEIIQTAYRTGDSGKVVVDDVTYNLRDMLKEVMKEVTALQEGMQYGTLSPYSYFYNAEGKNWWAEAIKGDTDKLYPVIDRYAHDESISGYHGAVRNYYNSGTGAAWDGKDYIAGYRGLNIPLYTLGLSVGATVEITNQDTVDVLMNISSGEAYAFSAYSEDDLNTVFANITQSAATAATRAWFTDTIGKDYDLLTKELNGVTPAIEVREYTLDANHNRTGEYTVLERITFETDPVTGKLSAFSSAVFDSVMDGDDGVPELKYRDILAAGDNVIRGRYIYFNLNSTPSRIDLTGDGVGDYDLQPETFMWIIGALGTSEMVLDYPVYLTGSDPDDPAPKPWAGDYPTNESAPLHYINYRGDDRVLETVSPEFPWGKARVGYGFYLVDENGNPLVNPLTDEIGSIENAVKLTRPAYQNLVWGTPLTDNKISSRVVANNLPSGYLLYTPNVNYYVEAASDGSGAWDFANDKTGTTYVQYGNTYTNQVYSNGLGLNNGEIHDTVVWFAVKRSAPLSTDKTVEANGDAFTLTLEAFANGATSQVATVKPADIVLALDQSSSMYTPLGWHKDRVNLEGGDTNQSVNAALSSYKLSDFVAQARTAGSEVQENAKRLGYYIAVHNNAGANFMYLVHYAQNSQGKWGWYYISIDQTTRSIDMDTLRAQYDNPYGASDLEGADYKAVVYSNGGNYDLLTNVSYYKTQYGALMESVESFVIGLKNSGVNHRLGIVGFASPCYDGWAHYDGSGLYVDGEFYLYDTDFMYKGNRVGGNLTYTDAGFVEENWTGNVVLDPNKTFHATNPVTTELDSDVIAHAYSHSIVVKDAQGNPTGKTMYSQALVDVATDSGYESILSSIAAINANYQQTCPSVGIEMAEKIFAARSAETSARDKILVLFTDGVPTVRLYSNREHGFSDDLCAKGLYWTISGGVEDALDRGAAAKANGVQIYTVGTAVMQNSTIGGTNIDSGDFLNYLSSNYAGVAYEAPSYDMISTSYTYWQNRFDTNASNGGEGVDKDPDPSNPVSSDRIRYYSYYNGYGYEEWTPYYKVVPQTPSSNLNYAQFASSSAGNDLNVAFSTVMDAITVPTVRLDSTARLRDVLSKYFVLKGNSVSAVKVYTAPFLSDGTVGEMTLLPGAVVRLDKTDINSDRYDIIDVSGYDYQSEYFSSEPRYIGDVPYYGSKLIVKIDVLPREGFWGGNNIPTNDTLTGIYDNDGTKVQEFPVPEVNVPVKPVITPMDQVVYYGETKIDAMDLVSGITMGGKPVVYNEAEGTFHPAEDWMDDYAVLSWTADTADVDYCHPAALISGTAPAAYTFGITMTPRKGADGTVHDGQSNLTMGDGNIAGTPVTAVLSDPAVGNVDILVPVITFKDSEILLGTGVNKDYYDSTNYVDGIQWVNKDDRYGVTPETHPTQPSAGFDTEPDLTLTYTPENGAGEYFTQDTSVDVQVSLDGSSITHESYFAWQDCDSDRHDTAEIPVSDRNGGDVIHKGTTESHEFTIHVYGLLDDDTVVIDFGLGVNISVLLNDLLPEGSVLYGVDFADTVPALFTDTKPAYTTSATSTNGSMSHAVVDGQSVLRYVLKDKNMQIKGKEVFVYAVECTLDGVTRYYYSTVTVIPATVIYYEDNFLSYSYGVNQGNNVWQESEGGWIEDGKPVQDTQQEDRPGTDQLLADANNVYGYDDAYINMTTYSNGSAMWTTVDDNRYAKATFRFWGTGFDVVSLTNSDSGTIMVQVQDLATGESEYYMVDTYYGYYFTNEGKWEVSSSASDTLYQVPVIKVETGVYSHYEITVTASYTSYFDHNQNDGAGCYSFWLDAIRIYNPAGVVPTDPTIKDAYDADGETKPVYQELRNLIIGSNAFGELTVGTPVHGVVFIDGNKNLGSGSANGGSDQVGDFSAEISEYVNFGPNNELYLAPGQAVVFSLGKVADTQRVHLALKSVGIFGTNGSGVNNDIADGNGSASVELYGLDTDKNRTDVTVGENNVISTATDLYYDITALAGKTVVLRNSGDEGIISVTNIKTTSPDGQVINMAEFIAVEQQSVNVALEYINDSMVEEPLEPEAPEAVFKPSGVTLGFEEEVKINVYFTFEGIDAAELGLITFVERPENGTIDDADAVSPSAQWTGSYYRVTSPGIPAKNMGDQVWFRIYAKLTDGSYVYSNTYHYSPLDYANSILSGDKTELKALVVAMLNYGAAAQQHFGYKTESLMNAGLTEEQKALVASYSEDMVAPVVMAQASKKAAFPATDGAFSRYAPSVTFGGAFTVNYYFQPAFQPDNGMTLYYWDKAAYEAADVLTADNATGMIDMTGSTTFCGSVSGIAAKNIDDSIYVAAVYEANGETHCSGVLSYSLGAYCVNRAAAGNALAAATAVYGSYAKAYFQN